MNTLAKRALIGFIKLQIMLALLTFLPAWSLRFWEAWLYWIVFSVCALIITLYFLKHDPRLIERRLAVGPGAESEKSQKVIQALAGVLACALIVVPGFDYRWRWSAVPIPIVLMADVLVVLGFLMIFFVFRANSHAASTVRVEADQAVISTGPYRIVRHPMYAGSLVMVMATPLALGSLWALPVAVLLCGVIVVRLLDEERYLSAHLPGYEAYCAHVRYRLLPLVW